MWKNLLIITIVATAAYLVGVESAKARGKNYEDLRHQSNGSGRAPPRRGRREIALRSKPSGHSRRPAAHSAASAGEPTGCHPHTETGSRPGIRERREHAMSADHMKNAAEKVVGKAKETVGHVTDDEKLVAEGKADQPRPTSRTPPRTPRTRSSTEFSPGGGVAAATLSGHLPNTLERTPPQWASSAFSFSASSPERSQNSSSPGKQPGGWFVTLILGVLGAMLGGWLGGLLFDADLTSFFSLATWLLAIGGSLVVLLIYGLLVGRRARA